MSKYLYRILLLALLSPAAIAASAQLVSSGQDTDRINLVFIPSGFSEAEQASFEAEVQGNLDRLWGGSGVTGIPWFVANKDAFDAYQVVDDWSLQLNPNNSQVQSFISTINNPALLTSRYDQGLTVRNIHIVILNRTGGDAGSMAGWIQITNQMDGEYTLAHEIGIHVLGSSNWGPAGQPTYDDEYVNPPQCTTNRHTKFVLNIHDRQSNDKWSHDVNGNPITDASSFLGGWYCSDGYYRPYQDSVANHPGPGGGMPFGFGQLGQMILDIGLGKRLGQLETTMPSLSSGDITGVSNGASLSGEIAVSATPSDASGIYRVDFYWVKAGDLSRSIKMDINEYDEDGNGAGDYRVTIDTTTGADGSYFLDVIAWDKHLNYRRVTTQLNVDNTAPNAPTNLQVQ